MSKQNEPAFPMLEPSGPEGMYGLQYRGMTMRDWFAGQALTGLLGSPNLIEKSGIVLSEAAFRIADAMLSVRERGDK